MPVMDGLEMTKKIKSAFAKFKIKQYETKKILMNTKGKFNSKH